MKRLFGMIACYLHGDHDWTLWATDTPTHLMIRLTCNRCGAHQTP